MKKWVYFIPIILYLYGCAGLSAGYDGPAIINIPLESPMVSPSAALFSTNTITPTMTMAPSPTIDMAATAIHDRETAVSAMQTADESVRINAAITNAHEQRLHDEMMIVEQGKIAVVNATGSSYPTSFAGTSTQEAINNTAIARQQSIMETSAAMTQNAPTQLIAMADAQAIADTAQFNQVVELIAMTGIGILALVFAFAIWKLVISGKDYQPKPAINEINIPNLNDLQNQPIVPIDHNTVRAEINRNTDTAYPSQDIYTIPCTPELMTRLAEGVINEGKPLGTNHWEGGRDPLFTRDSYSPVRNWIQQNKFSISRRQGRLDPTDEFLVILTAWLETKSLPPGYKFSEAAKEKEVVKPDSQNTTPSVGENIQPINKPLPEGV